MSYITGADLGYTWWVMRHVLWVNAHKRLAPSINHAQALTLIKKRNHARSEADSDSDRQRLINFHKLSHPVSIFYLCHCRWTKGRCPYFLCFLVMSWWTGVRSCSKVDGGFHANTRKEPGMLSKPVVYSSAHDRLNIGLPPWPWSTNLTQKKEQKYVNTTDTNADRRFNA